MILRLAFRLTRRIIKESNKKGEMDFLSAYKIHTSGCYIARFFRFELFEFRGTAVLLEGERPFSYGIQSTQQQVEPALGSIRDSNLVALF